MNKSILMGDTKGATMALSPEEVLASRKNSWLEWYCSAGSSHIHISPDGNVLVAACGIRRSLGNVYSGDLKPLDHWIKCPKQWCMCGTDMRLSKGKNVEDVLFLKSAPPRESTVSLMNMEEATWVTATESEFKMRYPLTIEWDITKRCNYSCSYCHPTISNKTDALTSRESFSKGIITVLRKFTKTNLASWVFAGGEPTIHPSYVDIVNFLKSKGHAIHTQTNGSRSPDYFKELIRYSSIGISVHLEFASREKLLKVAKAICEMKVTDNEAAKHWFGIRIMVPPGSFKVAQELHDSLKEADTFAAINSICMSMVYERENRTQLMSYTQEEEEGIAQYP